MLDDRSFAFKIPVRRAAGILEQKLSYGNMQVDFVFIHMYA
jgi:hypothetical protein